MSIQKITYKIHEYIYKMRITNISSVCEEWHNREICDISNNKYESVCESMYEDSID